MVSEAVKRRPHPKVVAFLRHLKVGEAYLSALTLGELVQGVARAPEARRAILSRWLSGLKASFSGRILPLVPVVFCSTETPTAVLCPPISALSLRVSRPI